MNLRGTKLTNDEFYNSIHVRIYPEIEYVWSTGVAITKFLSGLNKGKIIGSSCNDCDRVVTPPRMFCEECFNPMNEYVKLPDTGIINTFSLAYISTDATRVEKPQIPIVVHLDGTKNDNKPSGFLHLLDEVDVNKVKIGMKIQAVWKPEDERTGSITDIMYFKPLEG